MAAVGFLFVGAIIGVILMCLLFIARDRED